MAEINYLNEMLLGFFLSKEFYLVQFLLVLLKQEEL